MGGISWVGVTNMKVVAYVTIVFYARDCFRPFYGLDKGIRERVGAFMFVHAVLRGAVLSFVAGETMMDHLI